MPSLVYPSVPLSDGRLVLRPWRESDIPAVSAAAADPEIVRHSHLPQPFDEEAVTAWVHAMPRERADGSAIRFIIARVADGPLLGAISLSKIDWSRREAEVGVWLTPAARSRGHARGAMRLLCDWARAHLGLRVLRAEVDPDNAAGQRLVAGVGFRPARHARLWISR